MKKSLLMLAPMCAALLLSGCGGDQGGNQDGGDQTTGIIKEKTTIQFSTTAGKGNKPALERMIKSFEKVEPNVTVKLDIVQGNYAAIADQTIKGFSTGDYGDLVMVYPDAVADFIDYGFAFDLDPYINNTVYGLTAEDKADIIDTFEEEGKNYTLDGTYSLPFSKSTEVVYYNRTKFMGLVLDGVNNNNAINEEYLNKLTWEEFFGVFCPALDKYIKENPDKKLLNTADNDYAIMSYDSDDNFFITLAAQYGYDYTGIENGKGKVLFNNTQMKELFYKMNEYAKKNYITSAGSSGKRSNELLKENKVLFSVGSTAGSSYQNDDKEDEGVFAIPHAEGKDRKVILQGPSVSILKHKNANGEWDTNRQLASWLFYKHCVSYENALDWATTANYMPIRSSIYESEEYLNLYNVEEATENSLDLLNARIANFVGSLQNDYFTSPAFKGSNTCRTQVGGVTAAALTKTNGQAEIDKAFKTAYDNSVKML